ncbi:MAG: hypothetical protein D6728_06970 [Cyanobacteria bacterium J055]|nr:MAG: hypothetical protein D6728_06970 [Cyanobacteria bacterium J055]
MEVWAVFMALYSWFDLDEYDFGGVIRLGKTRGLGWGNVFRGARKDAGWGVLYHQSWLLQTDLFIIVTFLNTTRSESSGKNPIGRSGGEGKSRSRQTERSALGNSGQSPLSNGDRFGLFL